MSSSPITSSTGLTSGSTLTNSTGTVQITGLASGINSTALIQAEMAVLELPMNNIESAITGLKTESSTLSSIQTQLQVTGLDAQVLAEPSTFFNVQTLSSSDSNLITAKTTNGVGAPVGSNTITVANLAAAAQTSFTYTPPTSGSDTLSISDGVNPAETVTVAANTTTTQLADQINGNNSLTVYAAVSSSGQLVLSSRSTGSQYTVSATDQTTPANLTTGTTTQGQNANYTINGTAGSSPSDTVTGAIPGVALTLLGVTSASNPVTITANAPGPDVSSIETSVQQFITDYNTSMTMINSAVNTTPASAASPGSYNPNSGSLFGDPQLENLMSSLRDSIITPGAGLPAGMAALSDLGISTGMSTGTATNQGVMGLLTFDKTKFEAALQSNPGGVQSVISEWAQSFQPMVNNEAGPGGSIANRVTGNTSLTASLQSEYTQMQASYAVREKTMEKEWSILEGTLSTLKSDNTYLTQLANLGASSSSKSG